MLWLSLSKKTLVIVCFLFPLIVVSEEDQVFNYPVNIDNKPSDFSNTVSVLAASYRVRSRFLQFKYMKVLKKPLVSEGHMIYDKNEGLYWRVETPFPSTIIVTSDRIVQSDGESIVKIDPASNPVAFNFSQIFFQLLANDFETLTERFTLYYFHCDQLDDKSSLYNNCTAENNYWKIGLLPKDQQVQSIISEIVLSGFHDVEKIIISDHSEDKTIIQFSSRNVGGVELSGQERDKFAL